jgi:hypothetical protein
MLIAAKFGIRAPLSAGADFKPSTAITARYDASISGQFLRELPPEHVDEGFRCDPEPHSPDRIRDQDRTN